MKQPLWIVNTLLLCFLLAAFIFIVLFQENVPPRESFEPVVRKTVEKETPKINISKIYEYDLFDTFKQEQVMPQQAQDLISALPQPPQPQAPQIPELAKPQFLDPLEISLKGIIVLSDDTQNVAIIADNKTNQEATYRVGSKIGDSQLVRILRNKIIFIRSNGQQEVLYLREADAKLDQQYGAIEDWGDVIQTAEQNKFIVNMHGFVTIIKNLAQFVDMLNLTTAYHKGISVGTRVGSAEEHSLGATLGLHNGDLITMVNNIPATDSTNRLAIYKKVVTLQPQEMVTLTLKRDGQEMRLQYELTDAPFEKQPKKTAGAAQSVAEDPGKKAKKVERMKQKYNFAPTVEEMKMKEKKNMFLHGAPKSNKQTRSFQE